MNNHPFDRLITQHLANKDKIEETEYRMLQAHKADEGLRIRGRQSIARQREDEADDFAVKRMALFMHTKLNDLMDSMREHVNWSDLGHNELWYAQVGEVNNLKEWILDEYQLRSIMKEDESTVEDREMILDELQDAVTESEIDTQQRSKTSCGCGGNCICKSGVRQSEQKEQSEESLKPTANRAMDDMAMMANQLARESHNRFDINGKRIEGKGRLVKGEWWPAESHNNGC